MGMYCIATAFYMIFERTKIWYTPLGVIAHCSPVILFPICPSTINDNRYKKKIIGPIANSHNSGVNHNFDGSNY